MRGRGFSLAEALITSFLFLLVLGVAALFMRDYSQVLRLESEQTGRRQAQASLERIAADARQAVRFSSPVPAGGPAAVLELTRLNPTAPHLPATLPDPLPASWAPLPAASLMTVRYEVSGGRLLRTVRMPAAPVESATLLAEAPGLSCRFLVSGCLEVELGVLRDGAVVPLRSEVYPIP
ncbi:MAG: hypothetical protein AB1758_23990 [Candidatus Eremiobacterota bacterium]